ncbi:GM20814 [Drosophila sechellia]|uniref:GM20814 n=1 Tax=Drosophila sechellia TaxID=7238 RepID=B4HQR0_DROSE|nr:GM20814 [Drosophila sechellia]
MAVIISCLLLLLATVSQSKTVGYDAAADRNLLAADLYNAVGADHLNENVVISPATIQSSMALAFVGAKGQTASELQQGLRLGPGDADAGEPAQR